MSIESYVSKYEALRSEMAETFRAMLKGWLQENPDKYIVFRTYIPSWNDGDPCDPTISYVDVAPGFVEDYFYTASGECLEADEAYRILEGGTRVSTGVTFTDKDLQLLKNGESPWDKDTKALITFIYAKYHGEIDLWNVVGTIKIVDGELSIQTQPYSCGY